MALTIYNELEQGTPEWLEARRGIVTASTVGKLLTSNGKVANNETSRALTESLVSERITGRVEYLPPTADMTRGTVLEPFARDLYEEHYAPVDTIGFAVREFEESVKLGYSPDGLVGEDGLIEIKSRKPRIHIQTIRHGRVPAANMAQLQAGLLVSGRTWVDYISYSPGLPLYVKRVHPNLDWFTAIHDAVYQFEQRASDLIGDYEHEVSAHNMPPTDYFNPFDSGEEIE